VLLLTTCIDKYHNCLLTSVLPLPHLPFSCPSPYFACVQVWRARTTWIPMSSHSNGSSSSNGAFAAYANGSSSANGHANGSSSSNGNGNGNGNGKRAYW
jgi:hypothetical protein